MKASNVRKSLKQKITKEMKKRLQMERARLCWPLNKLSNPSKMKEKNMSNISSNIFKHLDKSLPHHLLPNGHMQCGPSDPSRSPVSLAGETVKPSKVPCSIISHVRLCSIPESTDSVRIFQIISRRLRMLGLLGFKRIPSKTSPKYSATWTWNLFDRQQHLHRIAKFRKSSRKK